MPPKSPRSSKPAPSASKKANATAKTDRNDGAERAYPFERQIDGSDIEFRLMKTTDSDAILEFAESLTESDVAYLRTDITKPEVVEEWADNLRKKRTVTVLAFSGGKVIGYGSLHHNEMLWTRHLGEIRLLLHAQWRDNRELRDCLATEVFQLAKEIGLKRIFVQVPTDRPHLSGVYERLGFKPEALLTDWIMTSDGRTHDLMVLSMRLEE